MSKPEWWLISEDDAALVAAALTKLGTHGEDGCTGGTTMPGDRCPGCEGEEGQRAALHALESGLHSTDAVPSGYENEPSGVERRFMNEVDEARWNEEHDH